LKKITEIKSLKTSTIFENISGATTKKTLQHEGLRKVNTAGPLLRFANFGIDLLILKLVYYFGNYALMSLHLPHAPLSWWGFPGTFSVNVAFSILYIFYYTIFEYFFQKTPGKFITKTIIINELAEKPSLDQILLRTILRFIPLEPYTCINGRGFHDSWADTFVVPDSELKELKKLISEPNVN
jgi:uncharacterized RDD family membrane protein YckC